MTFIQSPPRLGSQYADDRVLRSYLARSLSKEVIAFAQLLVDEG